MIIVISNRNLKLAKPVKSPEVHPVSVLGSDMSKQGNLYGILLKRQAGKGEQIKLFPQGKENDMFDGLVKKIDAAGPNHELKRPWVMFVHGFNQTIEKNLAKARNIEKSFAEGGRQVNVIVFSWPSQPVPGKTDRVMKAIKKKIIKKVVRSSLTATMLGVITDYIEDYWRTYTLARMNAESSVDDMSAAYRVVQNQLLKRVRRKISISLIVHSLGNYLTQNTVKAHGAIATKFEHVILHQADSAAAEQNQWIPILTRSAQHTYITINKFDSVLAVSFVYNQKERLGQSQQGFIQNKKISYCDFTGIPGVIWDDDTGDCLNENDHDLFVLPLDKCADDMYELLSRLLRSKKTGLPSVFAKSGPNNFMRTRRKINYYQPKLIVDDFGDVVPPL